MAYCKISKISYYLPEQVISNEDFAGIFPEWDAEQIEQKVGIVQRHIAAADETAVDMAVKAAEKLFETYDRDNIDFVLFCTQSPDYKLPASSCILQDRLGLRTDVGTLDFNQGCSGYVYGLSIAKGLIASGAARSVLFLTGETYSKYMHQDDKVNRTIFGDAATATVVEVSDREQIGEFVFGSDGSGADKLMVRGGGARLPSNQQASEADAWIYMDGPQVFNFTIKTVPPLFKAVIDKNLETLESLDQVIFHQANAFMLNFLRKSIGIPEEKFFMDIKDTGNTVSNTIPIALAESFKQGRYVNGAKVALVGFGVGLSWAGTIIEID
jgi:3-oxoacyl-[acyl-carrier-protein] synthase III